MDLDAREGDRKPRPSFDGFLHVEHYVYIAIGILLSLTALVAIAGATYSAAHGMMDWESEEVIPLLIERLLFVLMIAEILHTVRVSMRSGALTCEPFLVVGLIASIRRVLVITLESSEATRGKPWTPDLENTFRSSMIELGVLGMLILVMVISIYLLRRDGRRTVSETVLGADGSPALLRTQR